MMKQAILGVMTAMFVLTSCVVTQATQGQPPADSKGGYPSRWENAVLTTDEYGFKLIVVRENGERWLLESKTNCFWSRQYVDRDVWLRWGPVESSLMNDAGEICEFWTRKRLE